MKSIQNQGAPRANHSFKGYCKLCMSVLSPSLKMFWYTVLLSVFVVVGITCLCVCVCVMCVCTNTSFKPYVQ